MKMRLHFITLFPDTMKPYMKVSIMKKAEDLKKASYHFYDLRDFTKNKHRKVDDTPYGGGPGMVLMVDPLIRAIKKARGASKVRKFLTILFVPEKLQFTNTLADSWLSENYTDIIFVSGRYEGFDGRVKEILQETELAGDVLEMSVGPYVLTGGEIPSLLVSDALVRRLPGVLGNSESIEESRNASHNMYTKPSVYTFKKKDYTVPDVLLSGNHALIESWRKEN